MKTTNRWRVFTAAYLVWCTCAMLSDAANHQWGWACFQFAFFLLSIYWVWRVWVLKKGII